MIMSSKQSMSRLKSGTGVALNEEESDGARVCSLRGEFQRIMWVVPIHH
jgi:hypothetical protein